MLARQERDIASFRREESLLLPETIDYKALPWMSLEARENLTLTRPATLGAAARVQGVTPALLALLLQYVTRSQSTFVVAKDTEDDLF
jgi:tRNA uridine 5-carboxymethylaminomethyl modification enzyme